MILGAIYSLHAKDLLSALISFGITGYGLVICFIFLKAPDVAMVQIVIETITLIIMVSAVLVSTRHESADIRNSREKVRFDYKLFLNISVVFLIMVVLFYTFRLSITHLDPFGKHSLVMSETYVVSAAERTGAANLVAGVVFDFRGYDTLGGAAILFTAVIGVLTVLRIKPKK